MRHNGTMAFQGEGKLCVAQFYGDLRRCRRVLSGGGGGERFEQGCLFPNGLPYATANSARMRR